MCPPSVATGAGGSGSNVGGGGSGSDPPFQFRCSVCWKGFRHPMSLTLHRDLHSGKTKCPVCERAFSRVHDMRTHVQKKHFKMTMNFDSRATIVATTTTTTTSRSGEEVGNGGGGDTTQTSSSACGSSNRVATEALPGPADPKPIREMTERHHHQRPEITVKVSHSGDDDDSSDESVIIVTAQNKWIYLTD